MAEETGVSQGELFGGFGKTRKPSRFLKQRFKLKPPEKVNLALSYENLVFVGIVLIMTLILSFSLGVEQGKQWVQNTQLHQTNDTLLVEHVPPASSAAKTPREVKEFHPASEPVRSKSEVAEPSQAIQPKRAPRSEPQYTIQLITFNKKISAEKELARLEENGYTPFISVRDSYYEICVGAYPDSKSAKPLLARFKQTESYHDAYLRKLK